MKYIKLDVATQTVSEVSNPDSDLHFFRREMGCKWIEQTALILKGKKVRIWFDEEGTQGDAWKRSGLMINHSQMPMPFFILVGSALISGDIDEVKGEETDCPLSVEDVKPLVTFLTPEFVRNWMLHTR